MDERLNFSEISALVVDSDHFSTGVITQILRGFGLMHHHVVESGTDAKEALARDKPDLLITEYVLPDMSGSDLIRWLRHHPELVLRQMPVVMLTGYTHFSNVTSARDSGANSVVRKPVSPTTLFDHISWSAHTERPFIEADGYVGPDRRFRFGDPAPGLNRRASDRYMAHAEPTQSTEVTANEASV